MAIDTERAAAKAAHTESAKSSRDSALNKWRNATADKKEFAALMVIANTGSRNALIETFGPKVAKQIWNDAGKKDGAEQS